MYIDIDKYKNINSAKGKKLKNYEKDQSNMFGKSSSENPRIIILLF